MHIIWQKLRKIKKILLKLDKIILLFILLELIFPQFSLANEVENGKIQAYQTIQDINIDPNIRLPINETKKPRFKTKIIATAYNSLPSQTDSDPCTTASGFNLCEHNQENIIATNFLPFGTLVKIPKLYGDKIFRVEDRMHPKYYKQIDIWFKDYNQAKKFGWQWIEIEVY